MMENEIWTLIGEKEIKNYNYRDKTRRYYVSNYGRARINNKIIQFSAKTYYMFYGDYLHRWVCKIYVPNPYNKTCVDHIDGNKHNNRADNLRWVTYTENMNNPITMRNISAARIGVSSPRKGMKRITYIDDNQKVRYKFVAA